MSEDFKFWAKTDMSSRGGRVSWDAVHPVICHMIDVGAVCEAFLRGSEPSLREYYLSFLSGGTDEDSRIKFLSAIIAAHDIGKIGPFQAKVESLGQDVADRGFPTNLSDALREHGYTGYLILSELLPDRIRELTAHMIAAHHGRFWGPRERKQLGRGRKNQLAPWSQAHASHLDAVMHAFETDSNEEISFVDSMPTSAAFMLAGLTTVVDWIGSDDRRFPFSPSIPPDLVRYRRQRREIAAKTLETIGLIGRKNVTPKSFSTLFRYPAPNSTQQLFLEHAQAAEWPFLSIVESPTGEGKTEAVLYAYACTFREKCRGLFFGLPTQTTGNSMFVRIRDFLEKLLGEDDRTEVHLLHGDSAFNDDYATIQLKTIDQFGKDSAAGARASSWFVGRKRGLLAEHGVGTVDQSMLAVLNVKHFFVRLFALADKLVVIDEVHAYDAYMSRIIDVLIGWLHAVGASVVLLSATLPSGRKRELVEAFVPSDRTVDEISFDHMNLAAYPSITTIDTHLTGKSVTIGEVDHREIALDLQTVSPDTKIESIARLCLDETHDGGVLGCVVNTVVEAQRLYRRLASDSDDATELILFHSRFTRLDRRGIEDAIVSKLGKPTSDGMNRRPARAIVIATQVIEQSIDIDFDLLVTDLAPIDLILQRVGRMHRHRRDPQVRYGHTEPRVVVFLPDSDSEQAYGGSGYVYYREVLRRTKHTLRQHGPKIRVPEDVADLVEKVYAELVVDPDAEEAWIGEYLGAVEFQQLKAERNHIPAISRVSGERALLDGDTNEVLRHIGVLMENDDIASTRDAIDPISVSLVETEQPIAQELSRDDVRWFLDHTVRVSRAQDRKLESAYEEALPAWRDNGYLRDVRIVRVQSTGEIVGATDLQYSSEIGLAMKAEEETP
ncbi:MAG: CRISPR-associated helicase Cas3' [Alkalispirochaeta sp.]